MVSTYVVPMQAAPSTQSPPKAPTRVPISRPGDDEPPRRPDWLLIMVVTLFVLTLSVVGLVYIWF